MSCAGRLGVQRKHLALFAIAVSVGLLFLCYSTTKVPSFIQLPTQPSPYQWIQEEDSAADTVKLGRTSIRILSWTRKYSTKAKWLTEGHLPFRKCHLPLNITCEYTSDKHLYNISEAILVNPHRQEVLPTHRLPHHKWVFWAIEPPPNIEAKFDMKKYSTAFNITSTYASFSDVPVPYLKKCTRQNEPVSSNQNFSLVYRGLMKSKSRPVAWFVSRCHSESLREEYVKELQKYIPVDVYGKCGPYTCPRDMANTCYRKLLQKKYKFYLSFENSFCQDYVTEKLYNIYPSLDIVPVVLGAGDYDSLLPTGTYIDVRDFSSPAQLAHYLHLLDRDDNAYGEYLRRKVGTRCEYATGKESYACSLCRFLHKRRGQTDRVDDMLQFWTKKHTCLQPETYYKGIFKITNV